MSFVKGALIETPGKPSRGSRYHRNGETSEVFKEKLGKLKINARTKIRTLGNSSGKDLPPTQIRVDQLATQKEKSSEAAKLARRV